MTHTGYAMVDCTGLNLNTSSEQTITGFMPKPRPPLTAASPVSSRTAICPGCPALPAR